MENPELSTWPSPKIIVETDCSDYIIDMISFILLPEEMKLTSEIYSQPFEKYLIIVASRSSNLIAYCFDKIDKMCKKNIIYSIKEAHLSRILCIKSFKPSFSEQKELKTSEIPHCFISGGLDHYIKIWSALQGKLLRKIQTENNYISDLLIFQNGIGTNSLYLNYEKTCKYAKLQINEEFSGDIAICVGPPKSMKIIDIESSNVDDIPNLGNYSVNSIQSIGIFSKGSYFKNNQPKNQIFFATVDKGSTLKVWKIVKRNKFIKCCCIKKIDLLMYWVLSLTSFVHSSNSYKRKYFLAAGGIKGNILQKKFYITIIDWKTSNILRTFQAHSNWINTLICIPFIYKGKMKDFIISGSADEEVCIWEANSGKLVNKVSGEGDRVVLHGMQFFYQEENTKKKFFLVSGGYHSNNQKNIFKVWV